jgi:hypothetical protein
MRPRILYVSHLSYPARGRRYCDEDIYLTARLRESFDLAIGHPLDAANLMGAFDAVIVRNSGPVISYQAAYDAFRARAIEQSTKIFTELTGKADMQGKQYLIDLTAAGFPVIPTVDRVEDVSSLPEASRYIVKPKLGSDSIGLRSVDRATLATTPLDGMLAQPRIELRYEVSFYFVDHDFMYALYAPDPQHRWELARYDPTAADLEFAQRFIDWNDVEHGIQRVDACRTPEGDLLLVELEDLNPYLSLDLLDDATRGLFVDRLTQSLTTILG